MVIIYLIIKVDNESDLDWVQIQLGLTALLGVFSGYCLINSLKLKIGVVDNIMILVNAKGKHVAGVGEQIYYSDSMLNIGDIFLNISRKKCFLRTNWLSMFTLYLNQLVI
jgi:hypothetical protein